MSLEVLINKGRQKSSSCYLNYFAQHENIFIMDNHLAAIWCWEKLTEKDNGYLLVHIDAHYDLGNSPIGRSIYNNTDLTKVSISELTKFSSSKFEDSPYFLWDNYIHLFHDKYPDVIREFISITQQVGDKSQFGSVKIEEFNIWDLDSRLWYDDEYKRILNLDIDYFFRLNNGKSFEIFSDEIINFFSNWLVKHKDSFEQIIIALSPECCGSWDNAVSMTNRILKPLGIQVAI